MRESIIVFVLMLVTIVIYAVGVTVGKINMGNGHEVMMMETTNDGGLLASGMSNFSKEEDAKGNENCNDVWMMKLDLRGNIMWQQIFSSPNDDFLYSMDQVEEGIEVIMYSESPQMQVDENYVCNNYKVVKMSQTGKALWEKPLGGGIDCHVYKNTAGGYFISEKEVKGLGIERVDNKIGHTTGYALEDLVGKDFPVVQPMREIEENNYKTSYASSVAYPIVYPNPSTGQFYFNEIAGSRLLIYDVTGKVIIDKKINTTTQLISLQKEKDGIYFYSINRKNKVLGGRLVKK